MLLLTNTAIKPLAPRSQRVRADQPFQPGEVFMIRYLAEPRMVTVVARRPNVVETDLVTVAVERFDQCVLFRMGRRRRILGMWLPWLTCDVARPSVHKIAGVHGGVADDFWSARRCSVTPGAAHGA